MHWTHLESKTGHRVSVSQSPGVCDGEENPHGLFWPKSISETSTVLLGKLSQSSHVPCHAVEIGCGSGGGEGVDWLVDGGVAGWGGLASTGVAF